MKQAVIFDLDGTLVDTIQDIALSVNYALDNYGLPTLSLDDVKKIVGNGATAMMRRALPSDRADLADEVLCRQQAFYRDHYADNSKPYPGIPDVLDALRSKNIKCAVLSNKPDCFTRKIIQHIFPKDTFACVRGHVDDFPLKPEPDGALQVARCLCISPADTIIIGDSLVDIQTGFNAGMIPVGVTWGFRSRDELAGGNPHHLIDTPAQLLDIL